ncbi:hypothetical protein ES703_123534 [subsurface metagenome]
MTLPPPRIYPIFLLVSEGLIVSIKTGPLAVARTFKVIPKPPAALSSAPYTQPPSKEVVCVPGRATTLTSKYWLFETAVGIIPCSTTTAVSRLPISLLTFNSGDCVRIYRSRYPLICSGHSAEPVPLRPPTSPYPSTGIDSGENTSAHDPIVVPKYISGASSLSPVSLGLPHPAIEKTMTSMLVTQTVFMPRISIVINTPKRLLLFIFYYCR